MPVPTPLANAFADAVRDGSPSAAALSAFVDAEELTEGVIATAAEELFHGPDRPPDAVDAATQCQRVARTAGSRWDVPPSRIDSPTSLTDLVNLLDKARDQRLTLRLVGSARSLSNVSQPAADGKLVATCEYGAMLPIDASTLRSGVDPDGLYRAEGGRVLADVLLDLAASERSLADMGSGCFQSLAGALSTATHGSGVRHAAFPGLVRSLDVVTYAPNGDVIVQRVEPTNGITDPEKFAAWVPAQPITLVQDDDVFHAWTVSLGCLGAIYSVTLATVPTYWLRETRTVEWWSDVQAAMAHDLNTVDYYELLVSTWPTDNRGTSDRQCLVTRRVLVTDPAQQHVTNGRPVAMRIAQTPIGRLATEVTSLWVMRDPVVRVAVPQRTGITASEVPASAPYTDTSYEVLLLRMNLNATSSELGIPLEITGGQVDPARAIQATNTILAQATANQTRMAELLTTHRPYENDFEGLLAAWREAPLHMSPVAVRYVAAESAFLAMQYGAPTCMIEMPMPGADLFDRELVDPPANPSKDLRLYQAYNDGRNKLFRDLEAKLITDLGARPHWGQVNTLTWSTTTQVFPAAPKWRTLYDANNHLGVFDGPVTDQLGISCKG